MAKQRAKPRPMPPARANSLVNTSPQKTVFNSCVAFVHACYNAIPVTNSSPTSAKSNVYWVYALMGMDIAVGKPNLGLYLNVSSQL